MPALYSTDRPTGATYINGVLMPAPDEPNEPRTDGRLQMSGPGVLFQRLRETQARLFEEAGLNIARITRPGEAQRGEMPNAHASEFSLVKKEAQERLYQVYNGPVGEEVDRDIATACYHASCAIDNVAQADGPVDLALNESNVHGLLTWALDKAGVKQEDRQALIKKMGEMGIGSPVTVGPAGSIRSGARQFEGDITRHIDPDHSMRSDGAALSRGYEPRERSGRGR
jgi:hypothetical protein